MIQRLLLASVICVAWLAAHAARATIIVPIHPNDGNLVPNPHFDTYVGGLSGWTESPTHPLDSAELQHSCDFEDQPGSDGVLLVKNEYGFGDLLACVPIRGGAEYQIGIWTLLPLAGPPGSAGIHVDWMADGACTTLLQELTTLSTNAADLFHYQWRHPMETFVAPVAARAIEVGLRVSKGDNDPAYFKGCLDEPSVIPEPSAAAPFALAALIALRRHRTR